jgi:hypothetical protein
MRDALQKLLTSLNKGVSLTEKELNNISSSMQQVSSSVGIVTVYMLDSPGIESGWLRKFTAPVETGPGAHPASCTMGTGSLQGAKFGRSVTLTPHLF